MVERARAAIAPSSQQPERRRASGVLRIDARAHDLVQHAEAKPPAEPLRARADAGIQLRVRPTGATVLASLSPEQDAALLLSAVAGAGVQLEQCEQHTDPDSGQRLFRLALARDAAANSATRLERRLLAVATSLGTRCTVRRQERRTRMAVFVSKYDHCLLDLLQRQRGSELDCDIPLIVSNHPDLEPLARQYGVDFQLMAKPEADKRAVEQRECELLDARDIDLVVMARYMQILSDEFVAHFPGRVINIHHSFLPAFIGAKPYHQARQRGVKLIGATAHYATAQLDEGPIIEQDVARCSHRDSVSELTRKGRDLERLVLARAVRWHLEDRVVIQGNHTVVFA
ncbi:MAG: hypothetical protein RL033_2049 [Pseudomonadota bacterium]|jgi:formyltetrahydrofolate deformylase